MNRFTTRRVVALACGIVVFTSALAQTAAAGPLPDSKGTEFWLAFPHNSTGDATKTLFISADTATSGTVTVPDAGFSQAFTVTPGVVTSVTLPVSSELMSAGIGPAVHVMAAKEITIYGLSRYGATTDAYLGLPVDVLGTKHTVMAWGCCYHSEFAVAASQDNTTLTITPASVTTDGHAAGTPFTVTLPLGKAYQAQATGDLTGSIVTSDKPVAVFGGHECANIPDATTGYCDHVVEQQPADVAWGEDFLTVPLKTRLNGDTFRILASQAGTVVKINGTTVATLGAGQFHTQLIDGSSSISASKPVLVAQFSNGTTFDDVTSDPFMMLIPPFEQFQTGYTVSTPASGFVTNEVNIVVPASSVGVVKVDGTPVPAASYTAIGSSGFSGAQVDVALGSHTVTGDGDPFGVLVYGFDDADSYGYPGGLSVAPIARATTVGLAPATESRHVNTQGCVSATVKDQNAAGVAGVRVDFDVTGANTMSASAYTDAAGKADFCYTGTHTGTDAIVGRVGQISAGAAKTWTLDVRQTKLTANPVILQFSLLKIYLAPTAKLQVLNPTQPLAGKQVTFKAGSTLICTATTAADGSAGCNGVIALLQSVLVLGGYTATFAGDGLYTGSTDTGSLIK